LQLFLEAGQHLVAAVNKVPATVIAAVFGCALGLAVVVTAFVLWQGQRTTAAQG
jgi:enoyl-CoA hydratase/carnithine racemase